SPACARSAVNLRFDCDAPGDRPNRLSAGQAVSTNLRSEASALGAMSVATTCSPLARNSEAQLAPITPVPMMAMRRMGLFSVMSFLRCVLLDFGIGDAGEIALGVEEVALVLSIEIGGIDRTGEVSDEHPVARNVEGDADSLHQVRDQDLWHRLFIDRGAIAGVAARRIAAIGPIDDAIFAIELEVDRFRQLMEQHLDIGTGRWALALGSVNVGSAETPQSALRRAFLRPIDFSKLGIDSDSDAPPGLIASVRVAAAGLDQRFDVRAIEVRAHHTHALPVAPIELALVLLEMDLLRREGDALRDDDPAIPAVEVGAFDRTIVEVGNTHIGPIDVTCFNVDDDPIAVSAIGDDRLFVGAIRIHRMNVAGVQFEYE